MFKDDDRPDENGPTHMALLIDRSRDRTRRRMHGTGLSSCAKASHPSRLTPSQAAGLADADTPQCRHRRVSTSASQPRCRCSAGTLER